MAANIGKRQGVARVAGGEGRTEVAEAGGVVISVCFLVSSLFLSFFFSLCILPPNKVVLGITIYRKSEFLFTS
ncbi:unnamed protein product [Camellia sinensis]